MKFTVIEKDRVYKSNIAPMYEIYKFKDNYFLTLFENRNYSPKIITKDRKYIFDEMSKIENLYLKRK